MFYSDSSDMQSAETLLLSKTQLAAADRAGRQKARLMLMKGRPNVAGKLHCGFGGF